jgi:hypothetical protein
VQNFMLSNNNHIGKEFDTSGDTPAPWDHSITQPWRSTMTVWGSPQLAMHGGVVTLIRQQWGWTGGTIPISVCNWLWLFAGPRDQPGFSLLQHLLKGLLLTTISGCLGLRVMFWGACTYAKTLKPCSKRIPYTQ